MSTWGPTPTDDGRPPATAPATTSSTPAIAELVEAAGVTGDDADLVFEMIVSAVRMGRDGADRGDLKLVNAALKELRYSFLVFEPYVGVPKVSIFGSARTTRDDPAYRLAHDFARRASSSTTGWSSPAPGPGSWRPASTAPAPTTPSASTSSCRSSRTPPRSSPATRSSSTTATSSPASSPS